MQPVGCRRGGALTLVLLVLHFALYRVRLDYRFEVAAMSVTGVVLIAASVLLSIARDEPNRGERAVAHEPSPMSRHINRDLVPIRSSWRKARPSCDHPVTTSDAQYLWLFAAEEAQSQLGALLLPAAPRSTSSAPSVSAGTQRRLGSWRDSGSSG